MRRNIKIITLVLWFSLLFHSCSSYRSELLKGKGSIEDARMNIITDFANTYKTPKRYLNERKGKPFNVFRIYESEHTKDFFVFTISPARDGVVPLWLEDTLGKISKTAFPNRYYIKRKKLFVWKDSITPLNQDVLNVLDEFEVLDSIDIKRELGLLPENFEDNRVYTIDHKFKSTHYYICKNKIEIYRKIATNKASKYYSSLKLKCKSN